MRMTSDDIWRAAVVRREISVYNSSYQSDCIDLCFRMVDDKYIFQMSGIKSYSQKRQLLQGIKLLGGRYIGGSEYKEATTHLIVQKALASEKFLAACAGGKWIVTPEFVLESVNQMAWLPEATYELNLTAQTPEIPNPLKTWRERVVNGTVSGAFQDWAVLIETDDPTRRNMFVRILKAGGAVVYTDWPNSYAVTHVLYKNTSNDRTKKYGIPRYKISYVAKHLFGRVCSELNWSCNLESFDGEESCETAAQASAVTDEPMDVTDDFSHKELEEMFKQYIVIMEQRKKMLLTVPEFYSYYTPILPVQIPVVDFSNVQSLVECAFFPQALEELLGSLHPGVKPPALLLQQLMQHTLQGDAKPLYHSMFITVLHSILRNNPTWGSPAHTKYFLDVLQCPECKGGLWSLLETSVRVCLASEPTCHSLPSPPSTELFRLHCNLQEFFLRLFQLELHAASAGSPGSRRASVLYSTFWNMWEKSTLSSRTVQQLSMLLIKTVLCAFNSTQEWRLGMSVTLQEILCVVVEFWAQEHSPLNSSLVEKGFKDLAEHIAILCQDLHCDMLKEVIPAIRSTRLRMFTADAIYRNICCSKGLLLSSEPLCLQKIVSAYLKALGNLCDRGSVQTLKGQNDRTEMNQPSTSSAAHVPGSEAVKDSAGGSDSGRETVPRGYHRVNVAGETLLHRACKKNQVETLLRILRVPGTDVNIKDHAGWTPLHEACNHGSTECVQALLQSCPNLQLGSQVQGVSPLHDALLNRHTHIAKMLLRRGGSPLLQLRDNEGQTPLDLISLEALREELLRCAEEGDKALNSPCSQVRDVPFIESCSWVLSCLLLTYLQERHVPTYKTPFTPLDLSPTVCRTLIRLHPGTLASTWGDSCAVSLAEDLRTVLNLEQHVSQVSPALRHCLGDQTSLFVQLLEDLQAEGAALITGRSEFNSF